MLFNFYSNYFEKFLSELSPQKDINQLNLIKEIKKIKRNSSDA